MNCSKLMLSDGNTSIPRSLEAGAQPCWTLSVDQTLLYASSTKTRPVDHGGAGVGGKAHLASLFCLSICLFVVFLSCTKTGQNKTHPWQRPVSVKAFQSTDRFSPTLVRRAHCPIIVWQLIKAVTRNINRFEVYFCQCYFIIISKANSEKCKQPPECTYIAQRDPFNVTLDKTKIKNKKNN